MYNGMVKFMPDLSEPRDFNGVHFSAPESGVKFVAAYLGDAPKLSFRRVQCRESKRLQGQCAQLGLCMAVRHSALCQSGGNLNCFLTAPRRLNFPLTVQSRF